MKNSLPLISIVIPSRNEESYIGKCLGSIIASDYPKEKMEIFIVDGMSEDKTREIVRKYSKTLSFIEILDNPKKIFAVANNIGIKNAKGNFIILLSAHATYSKNYLKECVKYLLENKNVDSVGGVMKSLPSKNTLIAKAIALSMAGRFGKGREAPSEVKEADSVFSACYRKEVFNKIGLFNENLERSSDMDLNLRLTRAGGKIHLIPDTTSFYYARANLKDFFLHNIEDGIWAILPFKFTKKPFKPRNYLPLVFFLTFPLSIWLYLPACFYYSAKISIHEKDIRLFFVMPLAFITRHFGYGFGSFLGLMKLII